MHLNFKLKRFRHSSSEESQETMSEPSNRKLLCLVTLVDSTVLAIEVEKNADGREILNQVCEKIGSVETDLFGLQYTTSNGEILWLNLRNPLSSELTGAQPHRLSLNIKFFVQPHYIQQESTRNLFYLMIRRDFINGTLRVNSFDTVLHLSALLAQAEHETRINECIHVVHTSITNDESCLPHTLRTADNIEGVNRLSKCLESTGVRGSAARNQFLCDVSELESYGVHYHRAHDEDLRKSVHISVGPEGIVVSDLSSSTLYSIPYAALQRATHDNLAVDIITITDDASTTVHHLVLTSKLVANALYRDLTEMYSFFHCSTVGSPVAEQFCRDLKGLLVSLFNEKTALGKKYVFDIERTLQEACDHSRRMLYTADPGAQQRLSHRSDTGPIDKTVLSLNSDCDTEQHRRVIRQLQDIHDAFTCHICADAEINTVFIPCGHVTCCSSCAHRLSICPTCKQLVTAVQPIYLPSTRPLISFQDNISATPHAVCSS